MNLAYFLTRSDAVGGAAIHVRDVASALKARGHHVTVMVGGRGMYVDLLRERGLEVESIPSLQRGISAGRDLAAYREVRAALSRLRPDLLSTHSTKAGLLGRMAAASIGVPSVFTAHGWAFTEGIPTHVRWAAIATERFAARYGQLAITVSEHDRELAIARKVHPAERVLAIHNGMPDVPPERRSDPGVDPARLIMIARFERQKDHATLLAALGRIKHLPWTLDLVGDGPGTGKAAATIASLGIGDRVRMLGYSNDVARLLQEAQVFVLASHWEGFPRSIIEAMRAGLPVIASDVGGVREAVAHGETGFLVEPRSVDALAQALSALVTDPGRRRDFGALGRARYEEAFTFERMLDRTVEVYRRVLGATPSEMVG